MQRRVGAPQKRLPTRLSTTRAEPEPEDTAPTLALLLMLLPDFVPLAVAVAVLALSRPAKRTKSLPMRFQFCDYLIDTQSNGSLRLPAHHAHFA